MNGTGISTINTTFGPNWQLRRCCSWGVTRSWARRSIS